MMLLVVLIVWALYQYTQWHHAAERITWFEKYVARFDQYARKLFARDNIRFLFILLAPLFIFWLAIYVFKYSTDPIGRLIIDTAVLWYCWLYQEPMTVIPGTTRDQTRFAFADAVTQRFATVFWFVFFGPLGALLYDFVRRLQRSVYAPYAVHARYLLEWPAARLLALGYALAGHFNPAFSYWALHLFSNLQHNQTFLEDCGLLALHGNTTDAAFDERETEHAKALVKRAEIMLLIALAIFTLGSLIY